MHSELLTPPGSEPVSLEEAKLHLRVRHDSEDTRIEGLITAARQYAEEFTRTVFITQTWRVTLDTFPSGKLYLPKLPLQAVTEVEYTDGFGNDQALTGFLTTKHPMRPYIIPAYAAEWPTARDSEGAVRVTSTAGYGEAEDVPGPIKQAILARVEADYYRIPDQAKYLREAAKSQLTMYRVPTVPL